MKVEAAIMGEDFRDAPNVAEQLERQGLDCGIIFEGPHDPFFPVLLSSQKTTQLELATGVAIAFARNPMICAGIAHDLQAYTNGRFILGLGSQIKPHIEKRFSMPWSKPAARMREFVLAIRAIWNTWETNERLEFRGEFYTHTLMTPVFNPGPHPNGLSYPCARRWGPHPNGLSYPCASRRGPHRRARRQRKERLRRA